jgi:hypothetical protein
MTRHPTRMTAGRGAARTTPPPQPPAPVESASGRRRGQGDGALMRLISGIGMGVQQAIEDHEHRELEVLIQALERDPRLRARLREVLNRE